MRAAAVALVAGAILAGCEFAAEPAVVADTPGPTAAALATPAASADVRASTAPSSSSATPDAAIFGAWRRSAVRPDPTLAGATEQACRSLPAPPQVNEPGLRPLVVTDARGEGVIVQVFADGNVAVGCEVDVDPGGDLRANLFPVTVDPPAALEDGQVTLEAFDLVDRAGGQRTIAVGRFGDGAAHVRAGFDDDTYTTAALGDGWYAMWWPGQIRPSVIVAGNRRNEAIGTVQAP